MTEDYRVPIDPLTKETLVGLADHIKSKLPPGWGFALLAFTYNDTPEKPGVMSYVSSAQRRDMLKAMQKFLRKQGS